VQLLQRALQRGDARRAGQTMTLVLIRISCSLLSACRPRALSGGLMLPRDVRPRTLFVLA
jgi:hypothetical protein